MISSFSINDIKEAADISQSYVDVLCNYEPFRIALASQKTGYGEKRFLLCPNCNCRRVKLYRFRDQLLCRKCLPVNVYKELQHSTKGGCKYISYIMYRFSLRSGIDFNRHPFHYLEYEKPKFKHTEKWVDNLTIMQALANMRFQTIFMERIWSAETINSVLKFTNSWLYICDLYDLDNYIIDWDKGVNMNTDFINDK